jgi:type I restriction enzyme S subunit
MRVASLLGALEDKLAVNHRTNRALETVASSVFVSWFVDFDPVAARRDGRRPAGVASDAIDFFPSHFEDSDFGPIPRGWRISTIGAEVTVVGGSTPSTSEAKFWNGDVYWLTPRDLSRVNDPVVLDTERRITLDGLRQISSGLLPAGTVLLSSRAPIGYIAMAEVPLAVNQGFIAMKCDKELSRHYVLNWTRENLDEVLSRAGGTTFAEISKAAFRPIPVVVPPPNVVEIFDQVVGPLHAMVVANVQESRVLADLRDTLLGPLLAGELTISAAEKTVEAAL